MFGWLDSQQPAVLLSSLPAARSENSQPELTTNQPTERAQDSIGIMLIPFHKLLGEMLLSLE